MLRSFVNMQASSVCPDIKPNLQRRPRGYIDSAHMFCDNQASYLCLQPWTKARGGAASALLLCYNTF